MKMNLKRILIVSIVVFLLSLSIGYALFNSSLTFHGIARVQGSFNMEFTSLGTPTCNGFSMDCLIGNIAHISTNKNNVELTINSLLYPGAYVDVPITITNKGNIPSTLISITEIGSITTNNTGSVTTSSPIEVTYTGISVNGEIMNQNETKTIVLRVKWKPNMLYAANNVNFTIQLNYRQSVQ